jgi:hypothetical protein
MSAVIKWSVILGVAVTIFSAIWIAAGMHTSPIVGSLGSIAIAILINLVVVFLCLRETAAENRYGKQLLNGALLGLFGGILIFLGSWLLVAVVFPHSLDEIREAYTTWLQSSGLPQAQVDQQIQKLQGTTAARQAVGGLIGTFITSVIAAAIIAIFQRQK